MCTFSGKSLAGRKNIHFKLGDNEICWGAGVVPESVSGEKNCQSGDTGKNGTRRRWITSGTIGLAATLFFGILAIVSDRNKSMKILDISVGSQPDVTTLLSKGQRRGQIYYLVPDSVASLSKHEIFIPWQLTNSYRNDINDIILQVETPLIREDRYKDSYIRTDEGEVYFLHRINDTDKE